MIEMSDVVYLQLTVALILSLSSSSTFDVAGKDVKGCLRKISGTDNLFFNFFTFLH